MAAVLLLNMPFANLRWPNLGPSLLKAGLLRRGIRCSIAYFNFDFAEQIGVERYQWVADNFAFVLGGEWVFAQHYFGDRIPPPEDYLAALRQRRPHEFGQEEASELLAVAREVPSFIRKCFQAFDWSQIRIVGFAASFQQTMASLCLARMIKGHHPQTITVFGGAACEAEMGYALWQCFPEIDYVFVGEADYSFPALVQGILEGSLAELPPGVVGWPDAYRAVPDERQERPRQERRELGTLGDVPGSAEILDLDDLPYPDFDDYLQRLQQSPVRHELEPFLFFEGSRGCWWGEKHHCKFCGLNGSRLTFRSKSPHRIIAELQHLTSRYGIRNVCAADNIFDFRYFDRLLPALQDSGLQLRFVYEFKCNLRRHQVEALVRAGLGAAQLGIETFCTRILRLANKGATGLQNLQTLKWFSEHPIEVEWNLLYGFPGEAPEDYAWLAKLIPQLVHLAAPLAIGRVRLDRFSPYFQDPEAHSLVNARPLWAFRFVFPFSEEILRQLAYHFEFDFADGRDPEKYARTTIEAARKWQELRGQVTFRAFDREDGVLILTDTRPCASQFQHRLTGWPRQLYLWCDQGQTLANILRYMDEHFPSVDASSVQATLARWIEESLVAYLDDRYLSLALRSHG